MKKVAIVTGSSSGIGYYTAKYLVQAGYTVYGFSRRTYAAEGVNSVSVDITDENQVNDAVQLILNQEKQLDLLVSNAGFGISGAAEKTVAEDAHRQLEVNLFGTDRMIRAVLPVMRKQNAGRIVCVSSMAGIVPIPFQLWYSVSKASINAYVLSLQNEVRPFGITVCAVLPGDIKTDFTSARNKSSVGDKDYGGRIQKSVSTMEHDEQHGISPMRAGKFVAKMSIKKISRPFCVFGMLSKAEAMLIKFLPRRLSNWIVYKIYG